MSDTQLKHRQHLGADIMPWTIAWIKISFIYLSKTLSLCLSLIRSLSLTLLSQKYLVLSSVNYLIQEYSPSIYPEISPSSDPPTQLKLYSRNNTSVGIYIRCTTGHPTPTLPIITSSQLPVDYLMCAAVYMIPNLILRLTHFQQHSHEGSSKN